MYTNEILENIQFVGKKLISLEKLNLLEKNNVIGKNLFFRKKKEIFWNDFFNKHYLKNKYCRISN